MANARLTQTGDRRTTTLGDVRITTFFEAVVGVATLAFVGLAPGVVQEGPGIITPATAQLQFKGPARPQSIVVPANAQLTLTGQAPTLKLALTASPAPAALSVQGRTPLLSATSLPGAGSLALAGASASLAWTQPIGLGSMSLAGRVPSISSAGGGGGTSSYRSLARTTYGSRTNTTITAPAGIVDGDILLFALIMGADPSAPTPTPPAGVSLLSGPSDARDVSAAGFTVTRRLYWKLASSESGDYTFTHATCSTEGLAICVQGGTGTPTATTNSGTGSTTTATGLTTATNNAYVGFIAHNWELYGTASPPTGTTPTFTEEVDASDSLLYYADGVMATAGATGDKTHTNLNSSSGGWGAFLVTVDAAGGASGATIAVPVGSLVTTGTSSNLATLYSIPSQALALVGRTPVTVQNVIATPSTGTLTLAGQALSIFQSLFASIPKASLTLVGQAPNIGGGIVISPAPAALVWVGQAPIASQGLFSSIPVGALIVTGQTPVLSVGQASTFSPAPAALVFKGPARATSFTVVPNTANLSLAGQSVSRVVSGGTVSFPIAAGTLTLAGQAPTRFAGPVIAVPVGSLALVGKYVGQAFAWNTPAALVLTGYAPTVSTSNQAFRAVPAGALTFTGPVFSLAFVQPPATRALALVGHAPTVTSTVQTFRPTPAGTLVLVGNTTALDVGIPASTRALVFTGWPPSVTGPALAGNPAVLTLVGQVPVLSSTQPLPTGSLALSGLAPVILAGGIRSVPSGALVLVSTTPVLALMSPVDGSALTVSGPAPSISLGISVTPIGSAALSLTGRVPAVLIGAVALPPTGSLGLTGRALTFTATQSVKVLPGVGSVGFAGSTPLLSFAGGGGSIEVSDSVVTTLMATDSLVTALYVTDVLLETL